MPRLSREAGAQFIGFMTDQLNTRKAGIYTTAKGKGGGTFALAALPGVSRWPARADQQKCRRLHFGKPSTRCKSMTCCALLRQFGASPTHGAFVIPGFVGRLSTT